MTASTTTVATRNAARALLGLVLALGLLVGLGAAAQAQTIPEGATLTVAPTTVTVTDNANTAQRTVQVTASGLQPGSAFSIDVVSGSRVIGTITGIANAAGGYDQSYVLPATTPAGPVAFNLAGTRPTGDPATAEASIVVIRLAGAVLAEDTSGTTSTTFRDGVQSAVGVGGSNGRGTGGVTGSLARTGAAIVIPAAILGACLLALGGVALRGGRRRRSATSRSAT